MTRFLKFITLGRITIQSGSLFSVDDHVDDVGVSLFLCLLFLVRTQLFRLDHLQPILLVFLTAAASQADTTAMLQEMSTVGVAMAVIVTAIWGCMVAASDAIEKRASKDENAQIAENCGDVQ